MAVFTNDLRLTELATGEGSGTWGTTTNTNLSLVADAFSFGTEAITTNADTHTTTIADGAADPGRSLFLKYTGTLDSACTITIGPNTVSKLWLIENATSGSQNIIIKQGSGTTVTVPNGQTKAIYSDGAGSGGAMVDAFAHLNVVDLTVEDDLTITDDLTVSGDLDVDGTANLDVVDIDGAVDMASTLSVGGNITQTTGDFIYSGGINFDIKHTGAGQNILFSTTPSGGSTTEVLRITSTGDLAKTVGDLTIDVAGDFVFDADGGDFSFKDGGTSIFLLNHSSSDVQLTSMVNNKDMIFRGNDGGSFITALTLDMSNAGAATFNSDVTTGGEVSVAPSTGTAKVRLTSQGTGSEVFTLNGQIPGVSNGGFAIRNETDSRNDFTIDAAGAATFSSSVTSQAIIATNASGTPSTFNGADNNNTLQVFAGTTSNQSFGLLVDAGTSSSDYAAEFRKADNTTIMRLRGDGNVSIGSTGYTTDTDLNLLGDGLSIKNDKNGSNNNWSLIQNTATSNTANLLFTTGGGVALTLNHDTSATFGSEVFIPEKLSHTGDTDTHLKFAGANDIRIVAGDVEHAAFDGTIVFNQSGADMDFRVESDSNTNMLFVDAANNRVGIGTTAPEEQFSVQDGSGGIIFLGRTSGSTTGLLGRIEMGNTDVDSAMGGIDFTQDGATNSSRIDFFTQPSGGVATERVRIDSAGLVTITRADNGQNLRLTTTDTDASAGPILNLFRDSSSPANNDFLGNITFDGRNDAAEKVQYAEQEVYITDKSDGAEDGLVNWNVLTNGTNLSYFQLRAETATSVFNEDSNDMDFRIESDGNSHMFFVDGGTNRVTVGGSIQTAVLTLQGGTTSEESLFIYGQASGKGGRIVTIRDTRAIGSTEGMAGLRFTSSPGTDYVIGKYYDGSASNFVLADQSGNEFFGIESGSSIIVNQDGMNRDFRVESDSNANLLVADAGEDQIYIGNNTGIASGTPAKAPLEAVAGASQNAINTQVVTAGFTSFVSTGATTSGGDAYNFGAMINSSGSVVGTIVVNHGSTAYNTSSDYRLKENVTGLTDATARIKQLQPKRFNFIEAPDVTVDGFLAHEVETVVPEAITGEKDAVDADGKPIYQGIDQSKLVPLLVATIQELEARIAALESKEGE